jgi:hypothetical protein
MSHSEDERSGKLSFQIRACRKSVVDLYGEGGGEGAQRCAIEDIIILNIHFN